MKKKTQYKKSNPWDTLTANSEIRRLLNLTVIWANYTNLTHKLWNTQKKSFLVKLDKSFHKVTIVIYCQSYSQHYKSITSSRHLHENYWQFDWKLWNSTYEENRDTWYFAAIFINEISYLGHLLLESVSEAIMIYESIRWLILSIWTVLIRIDALQAVFWE